jgi:hypothetical protein
MPDMIHCLVHLVSKDDMPDMVHQLVRHFSKVDAPDRFHHKVTNCCLQQEGLMEAQQQLKLQGWVWLLEAPRMDPRSWPDGEPQDEMSLITSHRREKV